MTPRALLCLAGLAAEFGVVMLIYLNHALAERGDAPDRSQVEAAVREGALLRVRPKTITVAVILAGLLPILLGFYLLHLTGEQRLMALLQRWRAWTNRSYGGKAA